MKIRLNPSNPETRVYDDLVEGRLYVVIGIEAGDYRIVNERGRPFLYSAELFDVVDPTEPLDWISEIGAEGERYAYPRELGKSGFFEDWFDGNPTALSIFAKYLSDTR